MRIRRPILMAIVLTISSLGLASGVSARTPVDPTSLTPPLKPFRVCWELGPYVQCDTSGVSTTANEPAGELPCGQLYQSATTISNSTRWYQDGLIVRRALQERGTGFWTLSPTGAGPIVEFSIAFSWDEHFAIPGDIDTGSPEVRGITLQVPALGASLHESGLYIEADDVMHGLSTGSDPAGLAELCALLVG
jgi:hypothetical protein